MARNNDRSARPEGDQTNLERETSIPRSVTERSSSTVGEVDEDSTPLPPPRLNPPSSISVSAEIGSIFGPIEPTASAEEDDQQPNEPDSATRRDGEISSDTGAPSIPSAPDAEVQSIHYAEVTRRATSRRRLPRVEKDVDDTTTPPHSTQSSKHRQPSAIVTSLSKLFAAQSSISPDVSRTSSYVQQSVRPVSSYSRAAQSSEPISLPDHIYTRGFLQGRHSDITVNAFGHRYRLHRLILDRAPFFRGALSEPWIEANAQETTIHPEDVDSSITQSSFELALRRLYGCSNPLEEESEAVGLFATGCWLEMPDLVDSSVESLLRYMTPDTLSPLIKLVTNSYYGRAGERLIVSAKSMLCRDGWQMPLHCWDGIPGDIVNEVVGGDGFFVDGEWERWLFAKRLLDRRLNQFAKEAGFTEQEPDNTSLNIMDVAMLSALRLDTIKRRSCDDLEHWAAPSLRPWISIYTHPEVEPLLTLLDDGIHYIHLEFEQLKAIRVAKDINGVPLVPEKIISDALWQQMELRQRVMNAAESEEELGISEVQSSHTGHSGIWSSATEVRSSTATRVQPTTGMEKGSSSNTVELDRKQNIGTLSRRLFWIPASDCNMVMGPYLDPTVTTSNLASSRGTNSDNAASLPHLNAPWPTDLTSDHYQPGSIRSTEHGEMKSTSMPLDGSSGLRYTQYPPFRFAASFPNPRHLKDKKRVYSRTVFYAGSLWNIYIQKVGSSRGRQLGVYLHRAKERESEETLSGVASLAQGSVDERIGQLEREMIMNAERIERRHQRHTVTGGGDSDQDISDRHTRTVGTSGLSFDGRNPNNTAQASIITPGSGRGGDFVRQLKSTSTSAFSSRSRESRTAGLGDEYASDSDELLGTSDQQRMPRVPTIPPYVDGRPTIKTYFKIYTPSRGGRMLSVYESAPDTFNFSQSWGWKSSTLMLDESRLAGRSVDDVEDPLDSTSRLDGDERLRFMVVIGNI